MIELVELLKELTLMLHGDELAEETAVQAMLCRRSSQIGHERVAGGIFAHRLLRIVGDIHHHPLGIDTAQALWPDQQWPDEHNAEDFQRRKRDRAAIEVSVARAAEHLIEHPPCAGTHTRSPVGVSQPLPAGNIETQGKLLALVRMQLVLQCGALGLILRLKHRLEMLLIQLTHVQRATQLGKLVGRMATA